SKDFPELHFNPTTGHRCTDDDEEHSEVDYELTESIVVLSGKSWRVFLTKNYMALVLLSFFITLLILISVIASILRSKRPEDVSPGNAVIAAKQGENKDAPHA